MTPGAGDRAWRDAGRDMLDELATEVRERAKAVDREAGEASVHDMRTATRRLRTALSLYGGEAPKKRRKAVEEQLKRVTRRLGTVRDLDILLETIGQGSDGSDVRRIPGPGDLEPLREAWQAERRAGARRLRAELGRRRFRRAINAARRLAPSGEGGGRVERIATRAPGLIWSSFGRVLGYELDPGTADPADIHQLRIAAKKLRYTLEAFEDALQTSQTLISEVRALQDAGGEMHDAIVAGERARTTLKSRDRTGRTRAAIDAFADSQARRADGLRATIATAMRTIRSREFREALARAVADMGSIGEPGTRRRAS